VPYKIPKLQKNAVPSIFPGPPYLSKYIKKRKPPTERQNVIHNKKSKNYYDIGNINKIDDPVINTNLYNLIKCSAAEGTLKLYCSWTDATIHKLNSTVSIYSFVFFCHNDLLPIIEKSVASVG